MYAAMFSIIYCGWLFDLVKKCFILTIFHGFIQDNKLKDKVYTRNSYICDF